MTYGLIGFGELGQQLHTMLREANPNDEIVVFDDQNSSGGGTPAFPLWDFQTERFEGLTFFVCLGYGWLPLKLQILRTLAKGGRAMGRFVHRTAYVNPTATLGPGTVVYPLGNVDKNVVVGAGVLVNNSVVISHDTRIGDACYLSPGVVVSGFVTIGDTCFLGSGSVVCNKTTIGDGALIGIGTVVSRNVAAGASVIGNPMRVLARPLRII
jgi:sugar O-acyltransferase (sialic acid O-acetyltransferase NeuD family)